LLTGGKSKNESIEKFFEIISGRVKILLLIGESGEILCRTMIEKREKNFPN
jgi:UDP-N-acetylmuramoylalanine-D-glutamate ligase